MNCWDLRWAAKQSYRATWEEQVNLSSFLLNAEPPRWRHRPVVYVVRDGAGFIKIGVSVKLWERMKALSNVVGPLKLVGVASGDVLRELELHRQLENWRAKRPSRIRGRVVDGATSEWYRDTPAFRDALAGRLGVSVEDLGLREGPT